MTRDGRADLAGDWKMKALVKSALMAGIVGTMGLCSATTLQARDPAYAYTGDPAYRHGHSAGYASYAYAPRYRHRPSRGYNIETKSWPPHYDPRAGYNSNTLAPWQDWKYQGQDY
jgi:hypothetical protein